MTRLSTFVAPWSLPGETIPLYIEWQPEEGEPLRFKVELPDGSRIEEVANVKSAKKRKNIISINELKSDGFFGIHFSPTLGRDEVFEKQWIVIRYGMGTKLRKKEVLDFVVVRPRLELIECPSEIEVTDDTDLQDVLNIKLKQTGSGFVRISIGVRAGGRILSSHEDMIWNFIRAMITKDIISKETLKKIRTEYGMDTSVDLGDGFVDDLREDFEHFIEQLPSITEEQGIELASEFIEELKGIDVKRLLEMFIEQYELFLTGELIRTLNKYPGDRSMLIGGRASARIDKSLDNIRVQITYRDSMENEYGPIECKIGVKDSRTKHGGDLVPINLSIEQAWLRSLRGGK